VLTELLKEDHTVFVHCNAGINRSPSVIACYLHWREDWHLDEALQHVRLNHFCSPVTEVIRLATWDRRRGVP
jgi:protein-tyrosine phosphatase